MPRKYKNNLRLWLLYSGSKKTPEKFFNFAFFISLVFGLGLALVFRQYSVLPFLIGFLGFFALFHGFLILAMDKRTRFVEKILPDALQLIAANIKSGFIPSRAIILSARKEFGPLAEAIKRLGKETMTGKPLQKAMWELTRDIKSDILETTVKLMVRGIKAGGQLVSLFEETAIDIRRKESIRREVKANIMMYAIFIGFAGCVGAPVLYALSGFLVSTVSQLGTLAEIPETVSQQMPLSMGDMVSVDRGFLTLFSVAAIIITSVFGGLIIGLIGSGSERAGIKYVPILIVTSLAIYFVIGVVIQGMFSALIPG